MNEINLSTMTKEALEELIIQIAFKVITAEDAQDCVLEICDRLGVTRLSAFTRE